MALLRTLAPALHRLDHAIGRLSARRDVLIEMRTPVYHAVLSPIAEELAREPDIQLWYTSEYPDRITPLVPPTQFLRHADVEWRRFDLYVNGDPWAAARLRRCAHRVNFFHGVAGKYDLDNPAGLPLGFEYYDRVGFINEDRMRRYLEAGVVSAAQAVLVGYPKLDRLARGGFDHKALRDELGFEPGRPIALYAPTYSEASSLHLAGAEIVEALASGGFNVLIKLHDRSLDTDARYTAGIDWRARCLAWQQPGRIRFVDQPDASPLLAVADLLVTDHSSIGFEFLVVDRPLLIFDTPDLPRVARINPEKVALLRRAATVVHSPKDLGRAAAEAIARPDVLSAERRRIAADLFHDAGRATTRAVALLRDLLHPSGGAMAGATT